MIRILKDFPLIHSGPEFKFTLPDKYELSSPRDAVSKFLKQQIGEHFHDDVVFVKKYVNIITGVKYDEVPYNMPECKIHYVARIKTIIDYEDKIRALEGKIKALQNRK